MTLFPRNALVLCFCLAAAGCASTSAPSSVATTGQVAIEGAITAIDTDPWTYDGNAVIKVDTTVHGQVAVQLPARWNLCKAAPVDVQALAVGMRVRAVGTMGTGGELVVCEDAAHRLVPAG